jgi:hypothetical protein
MNAERVRAGFARLQAEGPEAVVDLLDPAVEMLGPQASPWDCHGRDEAGQHDRLIVRLPPRAHLIPRGPGWEVPGR